MSALPEELLLWHFDSVGSGAVGLLLCLHFAAVFFALLALGWGWSCHFAITEESCS